MISFASTLSVPSAPRARRALAPGRLLGAALAAGLLLCATGSPARAEAPTSCTKFASPTGSDSANGTATAPFRTAQALANALQPGQVGCLRAGTYAGGLRFGHGGSAGAPLVVRSDPGESALITGRVYVPRGSDYVTVADLSLDSAVQSEGQLPSPTINANDATFEGDDVTDEHTGICFLVGGETWGAANSTTIADNRIHDCGVLPAANHNHGIYVEDATNTVIAGNLIDHNADRGIQLYPQSIGAVITGNVISENGEGIIFSGEGGVSSNDNVVEHNLIVNSLIRDDVESWYPSGTPAGVGNVVRDNCVSTRGIDTSDGGFTASANVTVSAHELQKTEEGGFLPVAGTTCASLVSASLRSGVPSTAAEEPASGGAPTPVEKEGAGGGSTPTPGPPAGTPEETPAETPLAGGWGTTPKGGTGTPTAPHGGKRQSDKRRHARPARRGRLSSQIRSRAKRAVAASNRHRSR
jgi:parallel beta-helix repeat protein